MCYVHQLSLYKRSDSAEIPGVPSFLLLPVKIVSAHPMTKEIKRNQPPSHSLKGIGSRERYKFSKQGKIKYFLNLAMVFKLNLSADMSFKKIKYEVSAFFPRA